MVASDGHAFRDVRRYPQRFAWPVEGGVCVAVTYKRSWDDGFGARGWKLDATIGDPQIIASTRETGERIDTSVFVHDILDHYLSGFAVSGHRAEAMALIQLAERTHSDPAPDYAQMVDEDIVNGHASGEPWRAFLPRALAGALREQPDVPDAQGARWLRAHFGDARLREMLVAHFFAIGNEGRAHARHSWKALGLDPERRSQLGVALQQLLVSMDTDAEHDAVETATGAVFIGNSRVAFMPARGAAVQARTVAVR